MNAEIIAVGTELLLGQIVNTNAKFLSVELSKVGVNVFYQTVVGDNEQRLLDALSIAFGRCDMVVLTGGLGPTAPLGGESQGVRVVSSFLGPAC